MTTRIQTAALALALAFAASAAWAKLPPPPPLDEKGKAAAEDRTVKNYQGNMKKAGKPIPKPTPIVAAAAPPQIVPGPGAAKATETPNKSGTTPSPPAVSVKGHEKGAMTPAGNTPPKGTDMPQDAKKK